MKVPDHIRGSISPTFTAFNEDGTLDDQGQRNFLDFLEQQGGISAYFIRAGMGQMYSFSIDDVKQLTTNVCTHLKGKKPVLVGCNGAWNRDYTKRPDPHVFIQQGIELGKSEGLALGQVQIDSAVTRLNQLAQLLQSRIQERDAALPEVLVQLVESLCRQVVGSELKMGAAGIGLVLEQSLAQLPEGSSNVRVFVSPVDYALLKSSHLAEGELALKEDSNLQAGDLRIQTEHSLVEYQSQERLSELVQQAQMQMRHALTLQQALNTMPTPDQSPEVQDDAPPQ